MDEPDEACENCGHALNSRDNYYFSENFARYISRDPVYSLMWCYHCAHVCIYEPTSFLKLIKLPALKLKEVIPVSDIADHPRGKSKDKTLGLFAAAHLLRLIWHCILNRAEVDFGERNKEEKAMHIALRKVPPREVALMAVVTSQAPRIVPLEQQIEEGMYLKETTSISKMTEWISSSSDTLAAQATLAAISNYNLE